MRDLTPNLLIGTPEEADQATFGVIFVKDPNEVAVLIGAGACTMVPTEEIAVEVLRLLGTEPEQIGYLINGPWFVTLPADRGCWTGAMIDPPTRPRRFHRCRQQED